jgi:hypothetical protein
MSDNTTPPNPEDMGDMLDEEIRETVHDWAENPDDTEYEDLDERIDVKLRRTIAGWVGADENAEWKAIGEKMDADTRGAIAGWVGADEGADWPAITSRIENRVRFNMARLVRAQKADEEAEASWGDIGSKIERDVRGWVGTVVGAEDEADWQAIGRQIGEHVSKAFEKVTEAMRSKKGDKESENAPPIKIEIEGDDGDEPPVVKSEEPVD